jgi:Protein tyrosine and serine/threonine kinase
MKDFCSRYPFLRPLGAGGMATVYLGVARGAGEGERAVAIKVMHPHLATDANIVAMFVDESRIAAQIHHPNVVATLDGVRGLDAASDAPGAPRAAMRSGARAAAGDPRWPTASARRDLRTVRD